ncbi:hypothetical protein S40285_00573 [Stachybotrys chlorohalonatus IBT 40285]|jgi:hypothetical protein|uniref:Signal peptide-containing protein n=1 Tax=Stachybotrys chlorohalonatus (strain IBT 40285) TaxID=1283841 RepID=A0A084R2N3_STAC4|nr:hypothetical protein S40285_00573 [Stachybotrys chlorohalonata IBT 40285]
MSFPIAVQSAIFYFVACTPCAKARHRQKAKEQAKKEREEKAKFEMEQPGLYRHPSPFNTNPYWQEEIQRGPSLPKKCGSKNSSQRKLSSSGREDSAISVLAHTNTETSRTNVDTVSPVPEEETISEDWNRRPGYQREDEELWGQWSGGQKWKDAFSKARDSAGRLIESTLGLEKEVTEEERHNFYTTPKNPPVNDYHPPVVSSKPEHKDARKWMLQPPPSAKIMEGKMPVSRTISSASLPSRSGASRSTASGEEPLGRVHSERLTRGKSYNSKTEPTEEELIESLFGSRSRSYPRSRSLSLDDSEGSIENPFDQKKHRRRPQPRAVPAGCESSDEELPAPSQNGGSETSNQPTHAVHRPKLPTILSAESVNSRHSSVRRSRRQRRSSRRRALSGTASPVGDDTD